MYAGQQNNHHASEADITPRRTPPSPEEPVQSGAEQESERHPEKRYAKRAQGSRGKVHHVPQGKVVVLRILLEQVGEIRPGSRWMGSGQEIHSRSESEQPDNEQDRGGNLTGPPI